MTLTKQKRLEETEREIDRLRNESGLDCPRNLTLEGVLRRILNGGICISLEQGEGYE